MMRKLLLAGTAPFVLGAHAPAPDAKPAGSIDPAGLARIGSVDERFQAYNIEMVEVTGGRFWAPYGGPPDEVYRQRPPLDLANPRLIALARHLGPSLVRVSGTWANNTYVAAPGERLDGPPAGFRQVLTAEQWQGLVSFSRAVDAPIVTSFAASEGTRDAAGHWTPVQAQRLADQTRAFGGNLYAAEFFNEPNMPGAAGGMPKDYDLSRYAADFRSFRDWARKAVPAMKILGPGGVSEGSMAATLPVNALGGKAIRSADMMAANRESVDAVSYHFYGTVSQRCGHLGMGSAVKAEALSPKWLDLTLTDEHFYGELRDRYEPGKPLWNTETGQAACGGSPWASTFLDTFRYLNQLGALAQRSVQVVMHNTLAASDYALIDHDTLDPRPSYWAAVLWRRTMGATVLAPPASPAPALRLFAQCLPTRKGGVGLLALNTGETAQSLSLGGKGNTKGQAKGKKWVLTGQPVDTRTIRINGQVPALRPDGSLAGLDGARFGGTLRLPAQSIGFVALPDAANPACS